MYRRIICLLSFALLLSLSGVVQGTDYYVSPSGNDNNTGTSQGDAWQTIGKVNGVSFGDGDSILFEGGQTFSGSLVFDDTDGGTVASPLTVSSYGTGRATISSGSNDGLLVLNRAAFGVSDLNFVGSGLDDPDGGNGITFAVEIKGGLKLEYVRVDSVEVSGYRWIGIAINGWNAKGGMS
ncbi:MAG: beta-glucosidase, partial [Planctomycetota bacterium]